MAMCRESTKLSHSFVVQMEFHGAGGGLHVQGKFTCSNDERTVLS